MVQPWGHRQTDKRYQVHYLPRFPVDNQPRVELLISRGTQCSVAHFSHLLDHIHRFLFASLSSWLDQQIIRRGTIDSLVPKSVSKLFWRVGGTAKKKSPATYFIFRVDCSDIWIGWREKKWKFPSHFFFIIVILIASAYHFEKTWPKANFFLGRAY